MFLIQIEAMTFEKQRHHSIKNRVQYMMSTWNIFLQGISCGFHLKDLCQGPQALLVLHVTPMPLNQTAFKPFIN